MNILEQIVADKRKTVALQKERVPVKELESSESFKRSVISFSAHIRDKSRQGIIAEFKRKSPSRGILNKTAAIETVTAGYARAGASALSVLTESLYFGGSNEDLLQTRSVHQLPVLRKDFIVEEYQVIEARALGADVILLIASVLSAKEIAQLAGLARSLGLEVLLEIHAKEELDVLPPTVNAIGVNNRNLKNFRTELQHSLELYPYLPPELVKVSESGIHTVADALLLKKAGFDGLLIGELFMREPAPELALESFIKELNKIKK